MSANKDGRNIQDARGPVLGSMENSVAVTAKLQHHLETFKTTRPTGAAEEFQRKIDAILAPLQAIEAPDTRSLNRAFNVAQGQLVQLGKQTNPENQMLRAAALEFARKGLETFNVAKTVPATSHDIDLNRTIGEKSRIGTGHFLAYLSSELQANSSTNWRSVNTVTALYNLSKYHPYWAKDPSAPVVARLIIERLDVLSNHETFSAHTVCNLAGALPSLASVFTAHRISDPALESKLFQGLTRAIENLPEFPGEQYVKESFLMPMREVNTLALTDEGSTALCAYVDRLNTLVSRIKYINSLETIATTFHGINGIFAWHVSEQNQAHLTSVLGSLNDRLEKNTEPMLDIPAGSILYGLRGIDVAKLGTEAQAEVARTLTIVAEKLAAKPPGETFCAVTINSMFTGLTTCISTLTEPIKSATVGLVDSITMRLPDAPVKLSDLGLLCGAMVLVRRTYQHHAPSMTRLRDVIDATNTRALTFDRLSYSNHIAWQNIHQMYALYERQMPATLRAKLAAMNGPVSETVHTSNSERRIGAIISDNPAFVINPEKFDSGFELDFQLHIRGTNRRINIEVDGVFHKEPTQRLMDNLRDAFFRRAGWEIYRVRSDASKKEVMDLLNSIISAGAGPRKPTDAPSPHSPQQPQAPRI